MKKTRSITIYIEKSGDRDFKKPFDPTEYLKYFFDHQIPLLMNEHFGEIFLGFQDNTMVTATASWRKQRPLYILAHWSRLALKKYVKSYYQAILYSLWNIWTAKKKEKK
jgi:hypothetical protein